MGYTHYYEGKVTLDEVTRNEVQAIIAAGESEGISIRGWNGAGAPEVSENVILLNGNVALDEDYETFAVKPGGSWSFCKTARQPYDAVVGAILLRLALTNPDFSVSSDGDFEDDSDWGAAKSLYASVFGAEAPALLS